MFEKRRNHTTKILLAVAIIGIFYGILSRPHIENLADYLPANETVLYAELPTVLNQLTVDVIEKQTGINLAVPALPELTSAVTLIRMKELGQPRSHTFVVLQPTNDEAQKNITDFFTGAQTTVGPVTTTDTNRTVVIAAKNTQDFQFALGLFGKYAQEALSEDTAFMKAATQHREYPYFVFAQPRLDQPFFILPIQSQTVTLPLANTFAQTFEAHFDVHDDGVRGELISAAEPDSSSLTTSKDDQAYRALTYSLLPIDPDLFVGGTSLTNILSQTSNVSDKLLETITAQYLPGIHFETDLEPLLRGEFGVVGVRRQNYTGVLLVSHLDNPPPDIEAQIKKLVDAFAQGAEQLAFTTQPFILRDGTQATERIPNAKGVSTSTQKIGETTLYSVNFGQYDEDTLESIFVATTPSTLLVSNDRQLITQAIDRAHEPGLQFRDGDMYRLGLQPILKNPQFTGVMHLDFGKPAQGLFSFSKRKFSDFTETQFQFMLE